MKNILNINLSGRVISIEDSAYEKLQSYIESLRRYFANEEGRDEIINDIESRIAELMSYKAYNKKDTNPVSEQDVEEIIRSMGRVEDLEYAEQGAAATGNTTSAATGEDQGHIYQSSPVREIRRLYRNTNDKFMGGVCSGIAAYINVDPSIVRILYAIISFGGFGFGFLAYIILWIVLPPKDLEGFVGKRLYRNPDDCIIGGVAGGLAAYFGKNANIIRLIFAAPVLLSIIFPIINKITGKGDFSFVINLGFGSVTGTFIVTYILLWIVLPEAISDYQKMEMRGETVDINRIWQNVREGMGSMKEKMKGWSQEVRSSAREYSTRAKEFAVTKGTEFASEFHETTRRSSGWLGHAIGVICKALFLIIAGTMAVGLFVAVMALLVGGVTWWPVNGFLWTSNWQQFLAWATLILFLVVPLVGFIIWIIRRITQARSKNKYFGWIFGGLWGMGWIAMTLFVSNLLTDFRQYEVHEEAVNVSQPPDNKLIVRVSQPKLEYKGNFGWMYDIRSGLNISNDTLKIGAVNFSVVKSPDNLYHINIRKYSFGRTVAEAEARAQKIQFSVNVTESMLDIPNGYAIDKKSHFRGQNVEVQIQVPAGQKIRFDESVITKLSSFEVKMKRIVNKRIIQMKIDSKAKAFYYLTNTDYTMGPDGILVGPDGENLKKAIEREYTHKDDDDISLNSFMKDEIRRKLKEENRKKKELEKQTRELEKQLKTSGL